MTTIQSGFIGSARDVFHRGYTKACGAYHYVADNPLPQMGVAATAIITSFLCFKHADGSTAMNAAGAVAAAIPVAQLVRLWRYLHSPSP